MYYCYEDAKFSLEPGLNPELTFFVSRFITNSALLTTDFRPGPKRLRLKIKLLIVAFPYIFVSASGFAWRNCLPYWIVCLMNHPL